MTGRWAVLIVSPIVLMVGGSLSYLHTISAPSVDALVAPIGRSATIAVSPGRADSENTFIVNGITGTAVRLLSRSLDMSMSTTQYVATPLGGGRWQVVNAEVPMVGRWGIEVQAQRNQTWIKAGEIAYSVPFTGTMHIISLPQK